jgi:hypothetical protein
MRARKFPMKRSLMLGLVLAILSAVSFATHGAESQLAGLVFAGLVLDGSDVSQADSAAAKAKLCEGAYFSRNFRYGADELNVLDVASTGHSGESNPRPVLLFVAGDSFTGNASGSPTAQPEVDQAMCFATHNKLVGVHMSYRLAPASPWPAGANDVAAAISWIHENIDLFGGDPRQIIAIGYSVGAFHIASLLAHKELQHSDSSIAGVAIVSGIIGAGTNDSPDEKSYLGEDTSKYAERSIIPGILYVDSPMLLAWSVLDSPSIVAESEQLKGLLCKARGACPRTILLRNRASLASLGTDELGEPLLGLVREIEARGLP